MEGKSKTEDILEVIALIISGIGFVLFFTAGIMGFAKTDQSHNMNIVWLGMIGVAVALVGSLMYSTVKHVFDEKRRLSTRLHDTNISKGGKWYAVLSLPIGVILIGSAVALFILTKGNLGFLSLYVILIMSGIAAVSSFFGFTHTDDD